MNTVVSEALATGLPVVTTRHSGLPEQVVDGRSGFLVDEGDFEALAQKLAQFIEHPEQWTEMGAFGRAHVLEHYDAASLIEAQIRMYQAVLEGP